MKVSASEHMQLESRAKTVLNSLKHTRKISNFEISKISQGEIKVVVIALQKEREEFQMRSSYSQLDILKIVQNRIPSIVSSVTKTPEVEKSGELIEVAA